MVLRYTHIHGQHIDSAISALDTGNIVAITPNVHTETNATANLGRSKRS